MNTGKENRTSSMMTPSNNKKNGGKKTPSSSVSSRQQMTLTAFFTPKQTNSSISGPKSEPVQSKSHSAQNARLFNEAALAQELGRSSSLESNSSSQAARSDDVKAPSSSSLSQATHMSLEAQVPKAKVSNESMEMMSSEADLCTSPTTRVSGTATKRIRIDEDSDDEAPKSIARPARNKRQVLHVDSDDDEEQSILKSAQKLKSTSSFTTSTPLKSFQHQPKTPKSDLNTPKSNMGSFSASKTPSQQIPSSSFTTASEKKAIRAEKFKEANEDRYAWLLDIRDAQKRRPTDPEYDPRTLFIPSSAWNRFTPFEKQFWEIKCKHWDTVVFFKKGKFYELYEKDADIGHQQFDLKLTDRVNMRMVGVPESSFEYWAAQFIAKGYKVAKVEQLENSVGKAMRDKASSKKEDKVIRRELTCVLTAGTLVDTGLLTKDMGTYCMSIKESCQSMSDPSFGICFVDTSTAEFSISSFSDDTSRTKLETLLMQLKPKELVLEKNGLSPQTLRLIKNHLRDSQTNYLMPGTEFWDDRVTLEELSSFDYFEKSTEQTATDALPDVLKQIAQDAMALSALGGLLFYLRSLKLDKELVSAKNFHIYDPMSALGHLVLDGQTLLNLDIFENSIDGSDRGTLFKLLNHCSTPFGKRLFKRWMCHPLRSVNAINARLDAIDDLCEMAGLLDTLQSEFRKIPDLERFISRIHAGSSRIKDFVQTLAAFQDIQRLFEKLEPYLDDFKSDMLQELVRGGLSSELREELAFFQDAFDHRLAAEQNCIRMQPGYDPVFDEAEQVIQGIDERFNQYLKECEKTLGYRGLHYKDMNKEIYQLEVPTKVKVPKDWTVMSKTQAVNRYYNARIRSMVTEMMEARENRDEAMRHIKTRMYERFDTHYADWMNVIYRIAQIDCLLSLAICRRTLPEPVCRPEFVSSSSSVFDAKDLRHPCVMQNTDIDFIPNDTFLGDDKHTMIVLTGPNMGGKSTLLRQTCIAVIMAQLGCYIPASSLRLTPFDRIFTRIGANDNIMAGQSTFMVELSETAKILSDATPSSLVILDELGRGTSTFDGYAIALGVLWHLLGKGCLGLFSTHYGALTKEFANMKKVELMYMNFVEDEENREVTFLYKLTKGSSPKSYGMNVASMAGVPKSIIDRAEEAAAQFESSHRLKQVRNQHALMTQSGSSLNVFQLAAFQDLARSSSTFVSKQEQLQFYRMISNV